MLYGGRAWLLLVNSVFSNFDYAISWLIYFSVTLVYEQIEKYFNPLWILSLKSKVEVRNQREGGERGESDHMTETEGSQSIRAEG